MHDFDLDAYQQFLAAFREKLRRIANSTQREYALGDVESEALLMALEIRDKHKVSLDFGNVGFRDLLFSHLYQRLVRYTETTVRHAVQLDHGTGDDPDAPHPLAHLLAGDASQDPLAQLLAKEAALGTDAHAENHPSLAAAYVRLLENFNYHMRSVASHLLVSISYSYRRMSDARTLAMHQQPLRLSLPSVHFLPGPWRKFKLQRPAIQLSFDFDEEPLLAMGL